MSSLLRQAVLVLLVVAQLALGSSAGKVVCLGGGIAKQCAEAPSNAGTSGCSHQSGEGDWQIPAPVEHHNEQSDCVCIDLVKPDASVECGASGDLGRQVAALTLLVVQATLAISAAPAPMACSAERPPGPSPGLRTTRLLI